MNPVEDVPPDRFVNRPVPRDATHVVERRGGYDDVPVAFATFLIARMTTVTLAVVDHLQFAGRECLLEA